jgi:molecular chaperone GrpE (heat shock protein)
MGVFTKTDNIDKILDSIFDKLQGIYDSNVYNERIVLNKPQKAQGIIQHIFPQTYLDKNLNQLETEIGRLHYVIEKMTEERISLKKELREYKNQETIIKNHEDSYNEISEELKVVKMQLDNAKAEMDTKVNEYEYIIVKHKDTEQELESERLRTLKFVKHLIELRDRLILFKIGQQGDILLLIDSIYAELGKILSDNGVEIMEAGGKFDVSSQLAVEAVKTDDKEIIDTIARTVRAGYRFGGKAIRPQEVALYVKN